MSKTINPTVGRKLWYWPSDMDRHLNLIDSDLPGGPAMQVINALQALDATVVYVWDDRMVNLRITDHNGTVHERTSVPLIQPDDTLPEHGFFCTWMPYQTEKAQERPEKVTGCSKPRSWQERLREEEADLCKRTQLLQSFMDTPSFQDVDPAQATLLKRQFLAMIDLLAILRARVAMIDCLPTILTDADARADLAGVPRPSSAML